MMGWDMGWNGGWMLFGGLGMLLFWGVLIAFVVWVVRSLTSSSNPPHYTATPGHSTQTPLEILQARYARGEISKQEYETIRQDLQA